MTEEYYIHIIHKYLGKEASPQEEEELKRWLQEAEANQERFEEERLLWKISGEGKKVDLPLDIDGDFQALKSRIEQDQDLGGESWVSRVSGESREPELAEEQKRRFNYLSIAASVVVLIALGLALKFGLSAGNLLEIRTEGEAQELVLADGSTIHLNAHSHLRYPEKFDGEERRVYLEGEAYFEVSANTNQPFIVETQQELVRVVGTAFNLRSFPHEESAAIYVSEGVVEFGAKEGEKLRLSLRDKGLYSRASGALERMENQVPNELAWLSGELIFEEAPLKEVILALERLHGVKIILSGATENCRFSGSFQHQDIASSLAVLALVFEAEIQDSPEGSFQLKVAACP